jgi:hypothetical protein
MSAESIALNATGISLEQRKQSGDVLEVLAPYIQTHDTPGLLWWTQPPRGWHRPWAEARTMP